MFVANSLAVVMALIHGVNYTIFKNLFVFTYYPSLCILCIGSISEGVWAQ